MPNTNEYMKDYMRERRVRRRLAMVELLGGVCVRCGTQENLEFNHIDPTQKTYDISKIQDGKWSVLVEELAKCELLCHDHHLEATLEQVADGLLKVGGHNKNLAPLEHGTPRKYNEDKCRCGECRTAKVFYRDKRIGYRDSIYIG